MTRVLIVDEEPQILRTLRTNLQARAYQIATAANGRAAITEARAARPDVILLDPELSDVDGVDLIRKLRRWSQVPIVVLSGRVRSQHKIDALDAGADDYVNKPFCLEELLARIRAVTRRRSTNQPAPTVALGDVRVDFGAHTVVHVENARSTVHLTRTEWRVLEILTENPGRMVSQQQLLHDVWGPYYTTQKHYLRQYIAGLRRKLEAEPSRPRHLMTEPGMGYRFQP